MTDASMKPDVPADVKAVIDAASAEFRAAIEGGDVDGAETAARTAWDAIPEPRSQWEFYPEVLPRSYADVFVRAGHVEHAARWLAVAMGAEPARIGENVSLDLIAARVWAAKGDRETAERIAGTLLELYGSRPFRGDDGDLLPLARAYRARGEDTEPVDDGPEEDPVPSSDGGATHERPDLDAEIERLSEAGSQAMDDDDWRAAVEHWTRALEILPAPRSEWTAATWLYTVLGDAYYTGGRLEEATSSLGEALKCPDAVGSPFLWLRLGQVLVDSGHVEQGVRSLASAYMLDGREVFEDQDPRYLELLADHIVLDAPDHDEGHA